MELNENEKKILDNLREEFMRTKEYRKLEERKRMYSKNMDYVNVSVINKRIKEEWVNFLEYKQRQAIGVEEFMRKMNEDDSRKCLVDLLSIMVMTNIMDFLVAEVKEFIAKYSRTAKFSAFDNMMNLSRECESQVRLICKDAGYEFNDKFAEYSDMIQEMITNEVEKTMYNYYIESKAKKEEMKDESMGN